MKCIIGLLLCACCVACAPHLVALYDAETDRALTDFQQTVDTYLLGRESHAPMDNTFYAGALADLSVLETRCRSIAKDTLTLSILHNLEQQLGTVKTLDKGTTNPEFFKEAQATIDRDVENALTLELAKQR